MPDVSVSPAVPGRTVGVARASGPATSAVPELTVGADGAPRSSVPAVSHRRRALPPRRDFDLDETLASLCRSGWTVVAWGARAMPDVLAAYQYLGDRLDVIVLRGEHDAGAYRALVTWPALDLATVTEAVWCYIGAAADCLWHVLALPPEYRGGAPVPLPAACRVPDSAQRHRLTIRPPQ